jgi:Uma2 family endonuclease
VAKEIAMEEMDNSTEIAKYFSLEDWTHSPTNDTEWVDGGLVQKKAVTLKHRRIQGNIYFHWRSYNDSQGLKGQVYIDVPCRTNQYGRSPDVAYLTPELLIKFGEPAVFPQSFPLIAEIVSPTDLAEDVITKAQEYLHSGSEEVWLIFPENHWVIVMTLHQRRVYISGEVISTQTALKGFSVSVDELLT